MLFYGHYDVQPVDPLELWDARPLRPAGSSPAPDGSKMITGRGTADDKGQLMTFVEACRAWKAVTGTLPIPVTVLLEGEEEIGRRQPAAASSTPTLEELRADIALICDTNMWDADDPGDHHHRCAASAARRSPSTPPTATCIRASTARRRPIRTTCWRASSPTCTTPTAG